LFRPKWPSGLDRYRLFSSCAGTGSAGGSPGDGVFRALSSLVDSSRRRRSPAWTPKVAANCRNSSSFSSSGYHAPGKARAGAGCGSGAPPTHWPAAYTLRSIGGFRPVRCARGAPRSRPHRRKSWFPGISRSRLPWAMRSCRRRWHSAKSVRTQDWRSTNSRSLKSRSALPVEPV